MRLLNIRTLELESFYNEPPPYAILSHTWERDEVTLQELGKPGTEIKRGWKKIRNFCRVVADALPHLDYAWVDTCCIDKTSSAELSEAINAMFTWYREAFACFAYLSDVKHTNGQPVDAQFENSRWFTRGWTLQELLAPTCVKFYDQDWIYMGDKSILSRAISKASKIEEDALSLTDWTSVSAARKMSWASLRETTRTEDMAYCLLGLFDVNMTMLYGEGEKAFIRLQEEILKETDDHSLLAWDATDVPASVTSIGVLASHPCFFKNCGAIEAHPSEGEPLSITNRGIRINLFIMEQAYHPRQTLGVLSCFSSADVSSAVAILIEQDRHNRSRYSRTRSKTIEFPIRTSFLKGETIFITKRHQVSTTAGRISKCWMQYSQCEIVSAEPSENWQSSSISESLTMAMPPSTGETARATVTFKTTNSDESFGVSLLMKPRDGTGAVDASPLLESQLWKNSLDEASAEQIAVGPGARMELTLGQAQVLVQMKLQYVRGSRMYVASVICVPQT